MTRANERDSTGLAVELREQSLNFAGHADDVGRPWRFCVAPMVDVTDRHCRYFHRLLAPDARLYTEMIAAAALEHGNVGQLLDFDPVEHPVALQLGGHEPVSLARAARLGEQWGYAEINLNCGCPSDRVQKGSFGACLMAEPKQVADAIKAMQDAVAIPVTVKHRLGLDYDESYGFVRDFVGTLHAAGCRVFIVHARNAVLQGLSPKENRQRPPLRYDMVRQLKRDFPDAAMVINGGLTTLDQCLHWMTELDGVMLGRAAWHTPDILRSINRTIAPETVPADPQALFEQFLSYAEEQFDQGVPAHILLRALLGWHAGRPGARQWRRTLSDATRLKTEGLQVLREAWQALPAQLRADTVVGGGH